MRFIRLMKGFLLLTIASLVSCWSESERVVAETKDGKIRVIETTLYAKPAEDPYAFLKKKHRSYDMEIINDSIQKKPIAYERAFNDPVEWRLIASKEIVAYKKGDELWSVFPLISPRCDTHIKDFDPKGELTVEKYAYYWMGCEPIVMVQHVSPMKAVEVLEQWWAEPYDGYEIPYDPWMEAYKILSPESRKMIRTKMIEIDKSLTPEQRENASSDFMRRVKMFKESKE